MKWSILLMFAICGSLVAAGPKNSAKASKTREITFSIVLESSAQDVIAGTTTFVYEITSNPQGGPAISHMIFGSPCVDESDLLWGNDNAIEWVEPDPTTGKRGIKFDSGFADQETRTVSYTLDGLWPTGFSEFTVKAATSFKTVVVFGPVCPGAGPGDPPPGGGGGGGFPTDPTESE